MSDPASLIRLLREFKYPNYHATGYDTRNYLDLDVDDRDLLVELIEAHMAKSNDEARADEKTGSRPPVHGNQNTINQPKPREQTELGRYPKRKSTDEY